MSIRAALEFIIEGDGYEALHDLYYTPEIEPTKEDVEAGLNLLERNIKSAREQLGATNG